jgi:hypothetical protein
MKFAKQDLVSLSRDPTSVGVVMAITPAVRHLVAGDEGPNHYQVYWSAGTNASASPDECWHMEEELLAILDSVEISDDSGL